MRFTVRLMMAFVLLLAVGLGALRYALTHWGPSEIMAIAPVVLLATNILAWFQRARGQVFWVGFGLCGWACLSFSLYCPLAEHLPTTWLLDGLHDRFYANLPAPSYDDFGAGGRSTQLHGDRFRRAGESVISLMFALSGGFVMAVLFPARVKKVEEVAFPQDGALLKPGWRDGEKPRLN